MSGWGAQGGGDHRIEASERVIGEARCCSVDEVGLGEVHWKSLAITWHGVDHAQSLVPWPDPGGIVSDRRGRLGSNPEILNLKVSELRVSETVYRDTAATGTVCTRVSKSGTAPVTVGPVATKPRVNPYPCGSLSGKHQI